MKRKYRIKRAGCSDDGCVYLVQVKRWFGWVTVKEFLETASDVYESFCVRSHLKTYANLCAEECLEALEEQP